MVNVCLTKFTHNSQSFLVIRSSSSNKNGNISINELLLVLTQSPYNSLNKISRFSPLRNSTNAPSTNNHNCSSHHMSCSLCNLAINSQMTKQQLYNGSLLQVQKNSQQHNTHFERCCHVSKVCYSSSNNKHFTCTQYVTGNANVSYYIAFRLLMLTSISFDYFC